MKTLSLYKNNFYIRNNSIVLRVAAVFLATLSVVSVSQAQEESPYQIPRTEHGDPDFQGVWMTAFITTLERPNSFSSLIVTEEEAEQFVAGYQSNFAAGNRDPEFAWAPPLKLTKVKGQFRSSIIVHPEDGKIPYSEAGLAVLVAAIRQFQEGYDGVEQRPLGERCLSGFGSPPMRAAPVEMPRLIVQNKDNLVLYTEQGGGTRIIRVGAKPETEDKRSYDGYSVGHWEGDTLVVETNLFRDDIPQRLTIGRFVLISEDTKVTERFTRVADDELNYQFTVEDNTLYSEAWSGEFSLNWMGGMTYEFSCHEGNYALPGILRGGLLQQAERASANSDR